MQKHRGTNFHTATIERQWASFFVRGSNSNYGGRGLPIGHGGGISPVFITRPVLFTLNMNKSTNWPLIFMRETSYCDSEINVVSKHGEISHVYETRIISHLAKLTAGRLLSRCLSCLNPIYSILYREDTVWQSWFCRHSREMRDQSSDRVNYGAVIALAAISKLRIVWQLWNLNYNLYLK